MAIRYTLVRDFFRPIFLLAARQWHQQLHCILVSVFSVRIWWPYNVKALWPLFDPGWQWVTFDPSNTPRSGEGFVWPYLAVNKRSFWAIWALFDLGWPQHDLWPWQYVTLWSGFLQTKFGSCRALTPTMHSILVSVSLTKFGGHRLCQSNLTSG